MTSTSSENKRIAKNTLLLYLRQFLVMAVSLYTSRIVLFALGVSDYGIYNVVGSVVTMFTFLRSAMGNATMRYIAFEIGRNNTENLERVFATTKYVHFLLALLLLVLSELLGLYLLFNKMDIPADRMNAAFWVLQFSIASLFIGISCVPYDAEIIGHEKMGTFAFLSILDVCLKLLLVFLLLVIKSDKLIFYGLFLLIAQVINRVIYNIYCFSKFPETRTKKKHDKNLVKEMFGFASWNIIGNMASIGCEPLLNVMLNMFFGPVVNAARGIACLVQSVIKGFIANFQMAVNPQITKSYSVNDLNRMHSLIITSSKFSFYLFFIIALPLCIEAKKVLSLWLVEVPDHSVSFLRIILFTMMLESWQLTLHTANLATGKVKLFQTLKGVTLLLMLPISYVALKMGSKPEFVFIIQFAVTFASFLVQLITIKPLINLPLKKYVTVVFGNAIKVSIISSVIPVIVYLRTSDSLISFFIVCVVSVVCTVSSIYLCGLSTDEKVLVHSKISNFRKNLSIKL